MLFYSRVREVDILRTECEQKIQAGILKRLEVTVYNAKQIIYLKKIKFFPFQ